MLHDQAAHGGYVRAHLFLERDGVGERGLERRLARVDDLDRALAIEQVTGGEEHVDVEVRLVVLRAERFDRRGDALLARRRDREDTLRSAPAGSPHFLDELALLEPRERRVEMTVLALRPPLDMLVLELELELVAVHRRTR